MKYSIIVLIFIGLLGLSCGSNENNSENDSPIGDESTQVGGIHLSYLIQIDNIPLIGPQSEQIDLYLASGFARYDGLVDISVVDEIRQIHRSSILRYEDYRQTIINFEDSTYQVRFYDSESGENDEGDSLTESRPELSRITVTRTDQLEDIDDFGSCRKWSIRTSRTKKIKSAQSDSIPALSGALWIKEESADSVYLRDYYAALKKCFHDPDFDGLELWRVLHKLDISSEHLIKILDNIDGLIVKADLVCERYSLGRKARITVSANLTDMLEQKLLRVIFEIPEGYKAEVVREKAAN